MTIQRMDNVLIVVDDLEAAKSFFIELGLELEGETQVEGPSVDSLIGLKDVRDTLALMRTLAVGGRPQREGGANVLEPDQAVDRRSLDLRLAFELKAEFDEERLGRLEVVDNDENVVHPLNRHVLTLLVAGPAISLGGRVD